MTPYSNFNLLRALGVALLLLKASPAFGQAAPTSRVTPSTIAPQAPQSQPEPILRAPTHNVDAPASASTLSVTIRKFEVIDGYPDLANLVRIEAAKAEGRQTTISELYAIAARIEAIYAQEGYFLARVVVPPQRVDDGGTFSIRIVKGYIESIQINVLDPNSKKLIERRLGALIGNTDLTYAELERRISLAGDGPGLTLTSALTRGEKVGGVRLVVQGKFRPVAVRVGFDNSVADGFSGVQFWTQGILNNVLGHGEVIYGSIFNGPDLDRVVANNPERRVLGVGAIIPAGNNGLSLNPEFVSARIHPREQPGILITTGNFTRVSLKLAYPLIRSRAQNLILSGGFEAVDEDQIADEFDTALSIDKLRIASFSADWNANLSGNLSFASRFSVNQGINALGARDRADVAATRIGFSRSGSRPDYTKINIDWSARYLSSGRLNASLSFHFQHSLTGALPSYGQFRMDSEDGLSAFAPGTFSVDSGLTLRGEFGPRVAGSTFNVAPYVFGAFGTGHLANPTRLETSNMLGGRSGSAPEQPCSRPIPDRRCKRRLR
ncbi:MAG: hypothetical protein K2Y20_15960 [Sphingomonas sp.]|nr:hypothetical protein [Sphingomonas sp.]